MVNKDINEKFNFIRKRKRQENDEITNKKKKKDLKEKNYDNSNNPCSILDIINNIRKNDIMIQYNSLIELNNIIQIDEIVNIDQVINSNIFTTILGLLNSNNINIQTEILSLIINISANDKKYTHFLYLNNVIPILVNCLDNDSQIIKNQAILALNNIIIDSNDYTNISLDLHIYEKIKKCLGNIYSIEYLQNLSCLLVNIIQNSNFDFTINFDIIYIFLDLYKLNDPKIKIASLIGISSFPIDENNKSVIWNIFINTGFLKDIISKLNHIDDILLIIVILRIIVNITTEHQVGLDFILNHNIISMIQKLSNIKSDLIQFEIVCIINEIILNNNHYYIDNLIELGLIKDVLLQFNFEENTLNKDILLIIYNLSLTRNIKYTNLLVEYNCVDIFLHFINSMELEHTYIVLESIYAILKVSSELEYNFIDKIDENGIIDKIEHLKYCQNSDIERLSNLITHFYN